MQIARLCLGLFLSTSLLAAADDVKVFELKIQAHRFIPEETVVPSGEKFKLKIVNLDKTPEEFESYDFNREKIVPGGGEITVWVGPLVPGRYEFFGEFNIDTAKGRLIAQ